MKLSTTTNKEKEEGKETGDVLVRAMNTYRGNRGISPLILNLVARWR